MNKNFSVPNPCHEKWDGMKPQENGRYCGSCQKVVVDFTTKTNEEILDYIKENSGKKLCGTFKNTQLPPPNSYQQNEKSIRFLAALLLVFGMTLFSCNSVDLGDKEKQNNKDEKENYILGLMTSSPILPLQKIDSTALPPVELIEEDVVTECVTTTSGAISMEEIIAPDEIIYPDVIPDTTLSSDSTEFSHPIVGVIIQPTPHFDNDGQTLEEYIAENIHYPLVNEEERKDGTVYVTFVVRKDGSIDDVKVLRGIGSAYEEEAIRVVKGMPKWKPYVYQGKASDVQYNIPIKFKLK